MCGDGMNLGMVECDDGNLKDGDGCSHDCKIEKDYKCQKSIAGPDICRRIILPDATIKVLKGNKILIYFNKKITSVYGSDELTKHIRIVLESFDKGTQNVTWNFEKSFTSYSKLKELTIVTEIKDNIRGTADYFQIEFDDNTFFDNDLNNLKLDKFKVPAKRQLYITNVLNGIDLGFIGVIYATFIMVIAMNSFDSKPLFWIFINMLQMIFYIPLIDCNIPSDLLIFIIENLGVSKCSIPFELLPFYQWMQLPSWIPNPNYLIAKFKNKPLNSRFEEAGYTSTSFIYNFSDLLLTWIALLIIYFLVATLGRLFPKFLYLLL
jgi:cysteine-rich repeat protein